MASITGTFTAHGQVTASLFLRPGQSVAVTLTKSGGGTWSADLQQVLGQPPLAVIPRVTYTGNQSAVQYKNAGSEPIYLRLSLSSMTTGTLAFTLADVTGDQILAEWRTAEGTLVGTVTDAGMTLNVPLTQTQPQTVTDLTASGVVRVTNIRLNTGEETLNVLDADGELMASFAPGNTTIYTDATMIGEVAFNGDVLLLNTATKFDGEDVTIGVNDSGGTGKRALTVPNA